MESFSAPQSYLNDLYGVPALKGTASYVMCTEGAAGKVPARVEALMLGRDLLSLGLQHSLLIPRKSIVNARIDRLYPF